MQQLLLRDDNLDLRKTIKICQSYEQANNQAQEMKTNLHSNNHVHTKVNRVKSDQEKQNEAQAQKKFVKKDNQNVKSLRNADKKERITARMQVNDCDVRFQLDSAADANTICKRYVRREQVRVCTTKIRMFNDSTLCPEGEATLNVLNPKSGEQHNVSCIVVPNKLQCLLGLQTIRKLGFVTVNQEKFIWKIETTSQPGDLGEVTPTFNPEVKPRFLPCRKIPIALKDRVKFDFDNLVERGILIPVTKPTARVSQMAVVHKPNGKLRICLDPQGFNSAMLREGCAFPTLDDVLPKLQNARVFSKLDVKEAFWHVRLDELSSELTTMITPFGRYRWARLPF
ncbi:uncharacterized protein LOC110459805 [Mizuhopecten yessoensis]|uniref:uncharacterized protein LOC110459805 n=1 Tax=Mizuhopecten yessoensis TaxID=6573 RepID=UPI000B45F189|nr:uncharacterized protein LOC110459805 [Mizuhopecten yessoensis]